MLSCEALRADVLQLAQLLTESHPDPYRADGQIGFHRRIDEILGSLPPTGMALDPFLDLVRPLVASLGDGHTWIGPPDERSQGVCPRLWLDWEIVEEQLVVRGVYQPEHRYLIGARLVAVREAPVRELLRRMRRLRGADNAYNDLEHLRLALSDRRGLTDLLEESPRVVTLTLVLADGTTEAVEVPLTVEPPGGAIEAPSSVSVPAVNAADIGRGFLDAARSVAILRIDVLTRYREAFEVARSVGMTDALGADLAALPSATEACRELVSRMREAGARWLLVDLRRSPGGNSYLSLILEYFLYGLEGVLTADEGYQIKRFSPLYLENRPSASAEQRQEVERYLRNGGYDFSEEREWNEWERGGSAGQRERRLSRFHENLGRSPTFAAAVSGDDHDPLSAHVIVLTSAQTYSAGFDVAAMLVKHGATVVGVPSSQAGNCFIDGLWYRLDRSKLRGCIAYKRSVLFPRDPERGRLLRPDVELTYAYLARTLFDPHATVRLALERVVDAADT